MVLSEQQQLLQQLQKLLGGAKKRSTKGKVSRKTKVTKGKKVVKRRRVRGGAQEVQSESSEIMGMESSQMGSLLGGGELEGYESGQIGSPIAGGGRRVRRSYCYSDLNTGEEIPRGIRTNNFEIVENSTIGSGKRKMKKSTKKVAKKSSTKRVKRRRSMRGGKTCSNGSEISNNANCPTEATSTEATSAEATSAEAAPAKTKIRRVNRYVTVKNNGSNGNYVNYNANPSEYELEGAGKKRKMKKMVKKSTTKKSKKSTKGKKRRVRGGNPEEEKKQGEQDGGKKKRKGKKSKKSAKKTSFLGLFKF